MENDCQKMNIPFPGAMKGIAYNGSRIKRGGVGVEVSMELKNEIVFLPCLPTKLSELIISGLPFTHS